MIRDTRSGLALCPEQIQAVYLFSLGSRRPPVFEFDFVGYGFGISIQPRETLRNLEIVDRIISAFGDTVLPARELVARGAAQAAAHLREALGPCPLAGHACAPVRERHDYHWRRDHQHVGVEDWGAVELAVRGRRDAIPSAGALHAASTPARGCGLWGL